MLARVEFSDDTSDASAATTDDPLAASDMTTNGTAALSALSGLLSQASNGTLATSHNTLLTAESQRALEPADLTADLLQLAFQVRLGGLGGLFDASSEIAADASGTTTLLSQLEALSERANAATATSAASVALAASQALLHTGESALKVGEADLACLSLKGANANAASTAAAAALATLETLDDLQNANLLLQDSLLDSDAATASAQATRDLASLLGRSLLETASKTHSAFLGSLDRSNLGTALADCLANCLADLSDAASAAHNSGSA